MINVLFIGHYQTAYDDNKGDEAIIASSVEILRQSIPEARFTMFNPCSERFFHAHGLSGSRGQMPKIGIVRVGLTLSLFLRCVVRNVLRKVDTNLKTTGLLRGKILNEYDNADIIVDMTMDGYSEGAGLLTLIEKSLEIILCAYLGKPVIMFAQSIGPFNSWLFIKMARFTLNRTRLILLREEISFGYLQNLEIDTPCYVTACPSFTFKVAPQERVNEILEAEGIQLNEESRPIIGVSLNSDIGQVILSKGSGRELLLRSLGRLLRFSLPQSILLFLIKIVHFGKKQSHARQQRVVEILDALAENLGGTIILIPHDYGISLLHDDKLYTEQVYNQLNCKENVRFIQGNYSAEEVKGVIGQCDLFIGEKLHACIAALSQCIPAVGVGYSLKFHGIFAQAGQEQYLCNDLLKDEIIDKIEHAWTNREQTYQELKEKMPEVTEKAWLNAELVKQLVGGKR